MNCPNCQTENKIDAQQCQKCGHALNISVSSGASAMNGGVAAGEGGVAVGKDVHGDVMQGGATKIVGTVIYQAAPAIQKETENLAAPAPGESPFKGLRYFDVDDADLFFGREALTAKLVSHLRENRFLAVVGASGSGKSSVVRAGLVPALQRGEQLPNGVRPPDGCVDWQLHIITPTAHPLKELASTLTRDSESVTATTTLMDDLARDARSLDLAASRALKRNGGSKLLLVVDQFEELFTLCRDDEERRMFVNNLLHAVSDTDGQVVLVIALRADFYEHCFSYANLRQAIERWQVTIGQMELAELRQAIEEPARRGNWTLEQGLVDVILKDLGASETHPPEPGALPLLSHALLETWKRRRGRTLTLEGYTASDGVRGAIAKTADTVYGELSPEQQTIARDIFIRLTELGEGTQDTRRRVSLAEFVSGSHTQTKIEDVLKTLADARLVTTDKDVVEVAHEALIREWATLRGWLNENREGLYIHRQLTRDATAWESLKRDMGLLYRGIRLSQAMNWAQNYLGELNSLERDFLEASQQSAVATQRRERWRNTAITVAGVLAFVGLILAGWFYYQGNQYLSDAAVQREAAQKNFNRVESMRLAAEVNTILSDPNGNVEVAALLSIKALQSDYSPQADATFIKSLDRSYTVQSFKGHTSNISSLAFSPDGKYVLTGSVDATARLWDVASGKEVRLLSGHTASIYDVAFSPDGKYVLTGSEDKTARLWDVASGKEVRLLSGHTAYISAVAFSPDGKYVLTGSVDTTARLWDVASGKEVRLLSGHTSFISAVAFSPDGKYVLTGSYDDTARLWDVASGKGVRVLSGHTDSIYAVAFSPDGKYVLTGSSDNTARLWDTDIRDTIRLVCSQVFRDFTPEERQRYSITDRNPTCPAP